MQNLAVLAFGLKRLKNRGWLVIEDIPERAVPVWELVAALLPDTFASNCCVTRQAWYLLFNDKMLQPAPTKKAWPPLTETLDRVDQTRDDLAQAEASVLVHLELYAAPRAQGRRCGCCVRVSRRSVSNARRSAASRGDAH
jgi:hypothetical protein